MKREWFPPTQRALAGAVLLVALLVAGIWGVFQFREQPAVAGSPPGFVPGADPVPIPVFAVVASYPGATAEEVERQVTIPLEVTLAGTPRLKSLRSQSLFGRCEVRAEFEERADYARARQEVINRLQFAPQLPAGVTPALSPATAPELFRYTLSSPRDSEGRPIYTLADLRSLQDWTLEREFRRVPRILDVSGSGGATKRYEIHLDPDRMKKFGVTLSQVQTVLAKSNGNVGGDLIVPGDTVLRVRGIGLFGGGQDPLEAVRQLKNPVEAAAKLRAEEQRRLREIRQLVVATVNTIQVRLEDVVEGGRLRPGDSSDRGVLVGSQSGSGKVALSHPGRGAETARIDEEVVQGVVWLRPGEEPGPALEAVRAKVEELNDPTGRLLPGVRIEPFPVSADTLWVRATFPLNASVDRVAAQLEKARALFREHREVAAVLSEVGGPEDEGPGLVVALKPVAERQKTPAELARALHTELIAKLPGIDWCVRQKRHDPFLEPFAPAPGEGRIKIIGPDLQELERLADRTRNALAKIQGVENVGVLRIVGVPQLEMRVDPEKCRKWGITVADVNQVIEAALANKATTTMIEGERAFSVVVRWPGRLRGETDILDLPVDVPGPAPDIRLPGPAPGGVQPNPIVQAQPRLRLRDLVSPLGKEGEPDPTGEFLRTGAASIYREQGRRLIAIRFSIAGREPAAVEADFRRETADLFEAPYRAEWQARP
jgi:Cu/Ag efflux pump CusA